MNFVQSFLFNFLLIAPALIISVTIHEFMHGFVSHLLGDPTPKKAGRLTLNPIRHLDPLGSLMILLVHFGWGKPMPINPGYYKNPRMGMMYSAAAGPLSNFLVAFLVGYAIRVAQLKPDGFINISLYFLAIISIYLGVFNLIPIPPLDGSKVLAAFLPRALLPAFESLERYGIMIIFLGFYFGAGSLIRPFVSMLSRALGVPII